MPETTGSGTLIAIGGHEDREGERLILRAIADALAGRPLLIAATASESPDRYLDLYRGAFAGIGVRDLAATGLRDRSDADDPSVVERIAGAGGVFLTGGNQARLLDAIQGSAAHDAMRAMWQGGGVIAGTSAGASVLGETVVSGKRDLELTPGLDFIPRVIVDQHFSQRDRMPRLLEGMARSREHTGIGIDEDTALVIRADEADVIGSGSVTVIADGERTELRSGDRFPLPTRARMR